MADGGKGKKNHPLYRTQWCEFFMRSHGCRWGNECWHCHSAEDFVRPMRAHYTFPMDLRLKPADADVPGTTLQRPQESGWKRRRWAGSQNWSGRGADGHSWTDDGSFWGPWQSGAQWETESESDAHVTAIADFLAAQAPADATAKSAHTTGGADDEQESDPLADPRLAALISANEARLAALLSACSLKRPSPADTPLPADPPVPPPADPPGTPLPAETPPADPPATRLLTATPLASSSGSDNLAYLDHKGRWKSDPPPQNSTAPPSDPPTTRLAQAPPPPPSSWMPTMPCLPPPPPPPRLDLTILSQPLQDDPFDTDADWPDADAFFQ